MQEKTFNTVFKNGFNLALGSIPRLPLKRYFIINQQIAQRFLQYSECLPFYANKIINPFDSRISVNHDKV